LGRRAIKGLACSLPAAEHRGAEHSGAENEQRVARIAELFFANS